MTEIPQWRCLLVRTGPENGEPDHGVVPDGRWLVFDISLSVLDTLTDEEYRRGVQRGIRARPTRPRLDGRRAGTPHGDPG
jgi:hypothetical protein